MDVRTGELVDLDELRKRVEGSPDPQAEEAQYVRIPDCLLASVAGMSEEKRKQWLEKEGGRQIQFLRNKREDIERKLGKLEAKRRFYEAELKRIS